MLSLSPYILLAIYGAYLLIHFFFGLISVGHIFKTGAASFASFLLTLAFLIYSFAIIFLTWNLVGSFPWGQPIDINYSAFLSPSGPFNP